MQRGLEAEWLAGQTGGEEMCCCGFCLFLISTRQHLTWKLPIRNWELEDAAERQSMTKEGRFLQNDGSAFRVERLVVSERGSSLLMRNDSGVRR